MGCSVLVLLAKRPHLFPSRTQPLSSSAPMILFIGESRSTPGQCTSLIFDQKGKRGTVGCLVFFCSLALYDWQIKMISPVSLAMKRCFTVVASCRSRMVIRLDVVRHHIMASRADQVLRHLHLLYRITCHSFARVSI